MKLELRLTDQMRHNIGAEYTELLGNMTLTKTLDSEDMIMWMGVFQDGAQFPMMQIKKLNMIAGYIKDDFILVVRIDEQNNQVWLDDECIYAGLHWSEGAVNGLRHSLQDAIEQLDRLLENREYLIHGFEIHYDT